MTTWPSEYPIPYFYSVLFEHSTRHYPPLTYWHQTTPDDELHPVYLEVHEDDKTFDDAVALYGYVRPEPESHPLTRFGVDRQRPLVVEVGVPCLMEAGMATVDPETFEVELVAAPGDRFQYSEALYEVKTIRPGDQARWGNTDIPLWYRLFAKRYREESDLYDERPVRDV